MATYQPGVYAFAIVVSDPQRKVRPLEMRSNVTVDRPMTDQEIAQAIVTAAASDFPNEPVLHLRRPSYKLQLRRRH
ncbi:hypothetical protein [Streptomyces sp. ICBB 8177]|uniref:hypothetical protein n=1 Tax=Streptomyces sp. ICBB 8177 TaxID=563922 RepID=UPI000D67DDB9|nr:hypothetical protein [Streptomyces sp. ICBB 8177]PWI41147.1 hypothetical protein CK485_27795 [Streptomyces sp. ICBB 8177]